jgi:hypothetical protein
LHLVNDAGEFVGSSDEGLRWADAAFETAVEGSKGRVGAGEGSGGLDAGLTGAVVIVEGARAQYSAA